MAEPNKDIDDLRALGEYWEREFCKLAADLGKSFTPMQIGKAESIQAFQKGNGKWNHYTLPDITIWTAPGEHHEVKHKNPTNSGWFGLEVYRFNALLWFAYETDQNVMYTIHNHDDAGGRDIKVNYLRHWLTANVLDLNDRWVRQMRGRSIVNSKWEYDIPTYYWPTGLWIPLAKYWGIAVPSLQLELAL